MCSSPTLSYQTLSVEELLECLEKKLLTSRAAAEGRDSDRVNQPRRYRTEGDQHEKTYERKRGRPHTEVQKS